jgi:hypothetical protein
MKPGFDWRIERVLLGAEGAFEAVTLEGIA